MDGTSVEELETPEEDASVLALGRLNEFVNEDWTVETTTLVTGTEETGIVEVITEVVVVLPCSQVWHFFVIVVVI